MIKLLNISSEKQKKIVDWLTEEIDFALKARGDLEDNKWPKWMRQFEGKPEQEVKNFPFEMASNLVAPIQSIIVNTFVARQYNTIMGVKPLWTVRPLNKAWTDHALPTQNLLDYAQREEMKFAVRAIDWLYDTANLGTGFVKVPWVIESKRGKKYGDGGELIPYEYSIADGPRFIPIPIQDFVFPLDSIQDVQLSPWVAHRFRLRWPIINSRVDSQVLAVLSLLSMESNCSLYNEIRSLYPGCKIISLRLSI